MICIKTGKVLSSLDTYPFYTPDRKLEDKDSYYYRITENLLLIEFEKNFTEIWNVDADIMVYRFNFKTNSPCSDGRYVFYSSLNKKNESNDNDDECAMYGNILDLKSQTVNSKKVERLFCGLSAFIDELPKDCDIVDYKHGSFFPMQELLLLIDIEYTQLCQIKDGKLNPIKSAGPIISDDKKDFSIIGSLSASGDECYLIDDDCLFLC